MKRLQLLAEEADIAGSSKYDALVKYLKKIGISSKSETRVVIFSERIATLKWLKEELPQSLKLKAENVELLHGGLDDQTQQNVIESFKMKNSPVRVLVTGDVASEGVNLHAQCHHLVHYDIPWSLIRIEQRNGRIDRYGQKEHPEIVTLLLNPSHEQFRGDVRVLSRLMEREHEAHEALGTAASLMGEWSSSREESEIIEVLAGQKTEDQVFADVDDLDAETAWLGDTDDFFDSLFDEFSDEPKNRSELTDESLGNDEFYRQSSLYSSSLDFLKDAVHEIVAVPTDPLSRSGLGWAEYAQDAQVELTPTSDLKKRLRVLPQSYIQARGVMEQLVLATSTERAQQSLDAARQGEKSKTKNAGVAGTWPQAHFLSPLHPVLEWASDRVLSKVLRQQVLAVRAEVDVPTFLLLGTYMNRNGQIVQLSFYEVSMMGSKPMCAPVLDVREYLESVGFLSEPMNPGPVELPAENELREMVSAAVDAAEDTFNSMQKASADTAAKDLKMTWEKRIEDWEASNNLLPGVARSATLKAQGLRVDEERALAEKLEPSQHLMRPLLMLFPLDTGVAGVDSE